MPNFSSSRPAILGIYADFCQVSVRFLLVLTPTLVLLACAGRRPSAAAQPLDFVERQRPDEIRVLNWNVKQNSIFAPDGERHESFVRIAAALSPDILCLQEIDRPDAKERLVNIMSEAVPGHAWAAHSVADNVVVSRFELLRMEGSEVVPYPLPHLGLDDFHYGQAAVLVDLPDLISVRDIYLICVHNRSQAGPENIAMRQWQSDVIASSLRRLQGPANDGGLPPGTPIVILGDLNVLASETADSLQHLSTLITGNIIDEASFGPDHRPDWDGSDLVDLKPRHNGRGSQSYTWRVDQLPFAPGALDRILYTDSVMRATHSFVLNTTTMSRDELDRAGLQEDDVLAGGVPGNFDHLPMVVDFDFR
jgi:endonuclease/exonuclease/phosphatase family metal-dependent hydrolase